MPNLNRAYIQQWTFWECDLVQLTKMHTELQQEIGKVEAQITEKQLAFDQLVAAGDPITLDTIRANILGLWQRHNKLSRRQQEIDAVLRQKQLDERIQDLGKRLGLRDLNQLLRWLRIIVLAASVLAIFLSLIPTESPSSRAFMDQVNFYCSLFLSSEFAARLLLVRGRWVYLRTRLFDVFLSLPLVTLAAPFPELDFISRAITLLRTGRLLRLISGERKARTQSIPFLASPEFRLLQRAALTVFILVALSAVVLQVLEGPREPAFAGFDDNLWWGLKIALTGNIDLSPQTLLGRLVTIGVVVLGVSLTGILIATLTAALVNLASGSNAERRQEDILDDLAEMRAQISLLTDARQQAIRAAAEINYALSNAQKEHHTLMKAVVETLTTHFGCLHASLHTIDEVNREVVLIASAGEEGFTPEPRIAFDFGIIGRCASIARRGSSNTLPEFLTESLPLSDGAIIALPLFVRRVVLRDEVSFKESETTKTTLPAANSSMSRRVTGVGVLHAIVPQEWLQDDIIRLLLLDIGTGVAQYLFAHQVATAHSMLLASIADLQQTMEIVTTTRDYERLLFVIAEGANALMNTEMSKLMLLDEQAQRLRGVAWHGMDDAMGHLLQANLGEGLSGICAKSGSAVKSSNLLTDQRVTATAVRRYRQGCGRNCACRSGCVGASWVF